MFPGSSFQMVTDNTWGMHCEHLSKRMEDNPASPERCKLTFKSEQERNNTTDKIRRGLESKCNPQWRLGQWRAAEMQPRQEAGKMSALQGEGLVLCDSSVLQD